MHNESRTGRQGDNSCIKDRKTRSQNPKKRRRDEDDVVKATVRSYLRPCHASSAPQRPLQDYQTDLHPRQKPTPTQSHSADVGMEYQRAIPMCGAWNPPPSRLSYPSCSPTTSHTYDNAGIAFDTNGTLHAGAFAFAALVVIV